MTYTVELLGTLPGGGAGPIGGANIQDSTGSLGVSVQDSETSSTPADTNLSDLSVTGAEANTVPDDAGAFQAYIDSGVEAITLADESQQVVIMQQPDFAQNVEPLSDFAIDLSQTDAESIAAQVETYLSDLGTGDSEIVTAQTESAFNDITQTDSESVTAQSETYQSDLSYTAPEANPEPTMDRSLETVVDEPIAAASPAHTTTVVQGASSVVLNSGSFSPVANTTGLHTGPAYNNTNSAQMVSNAGVSAPTLSGQMTLSWDNLVPTTGLDLVSGTVSLALWGAFTVGTLATGSLLVEYSTDGGTNWATWFNITSTATSQILQTVTITDFTLLKVRITSTVHGSTTGTASVYIDAVEATYTRSGAAG